MSLQFGANVFNSTNYNYDVLMEINILITTKTYAINLFSLRDNKTLFTSNLNLFTVY